MAFLSRQETLRQKCRDSNAQRYAAGSSVEAAMLAKVAKAAKAANDFSWSPRALSISATLE
jgi:hypothetical protein